MSAPQHDGGDALSTPLVFPYFLGPGIRGVTSALLYNGHLMVSLPGWIAPGPIETFIRLHNRVVESAPALRPIFGLVAHFFELAQVNAQHELQHLKPLQDKLKRVLVVYPGNAEAYQSWEPVHKPWLEVCHASLANSLNMCTASV